ncbi:hypothetical protein LXL04_003104 [Taraxacum kok-saghyz]
MDFGYVRPPPPPSDPHQRPPQQPVPPPPGTWYSGQFQFHSPSPPPLQWPPQTQRSDHHLPPPHPYAVATPPPMPSGVIQTGVTKVGIIQTEAWGRTKCKRINGLCCSGCKDIGLGFLNNSPSAPPTSSLQNHKNQVDTKRRRRKLQNERAAMSNLPTTFADVPSPGSKTIELSAQTIFFL